MKKYHVNPASGEPGLCRATISCRFGGEDQHFGSEQAARDDFENNHSTFSNSIRKQSFEEIRSTPTKEDFDDAENQILVTLGNMHDYSWDKLMGYGQRRSAGAVKTYKDTLKKIMENDESLVQFHGELAAKTAERKSYGRAFKLGVKIDPETDRLFNEAWQGNIKGVSKAECESSLSEYTKMKTDLATGIISPSEVVGTGYRNGRKVAEDWIDNQIKFSREAMESDGRNCSLNVSNVEYALRNLAKAS